MCVFVCLFSSLCCNKYNNKLHVVSSMDLYECDIFLKLHKLWCSLHTVISIDAIPVTFYCIIS